MQPKNRDIMLKGLVGLVVSVLMVWLGFYLKAYLAREILSIEHVEIFAIQKKLRLPRMPWQTLLKSTWFQQHVGGLSEAERDMIMSDAPVLHPDQQKSIETILKEFKHEQDQILEHVTAFLNLTSEPSTKVIEEFDSYLFSLNYGVGYYVPRTWGPFKKVAVEIEERLTSTSRALSFVLEKIDRYKPERTGDVEIEIVLLNSGNTDGLVRSKGKLVLMDSGLEIPISTKTATQIAKHSMMQVSFWIDKSEASQTAFDRVTARIKAGHSPPVTIELADVNGARIAARQKLTLPVKVDERKTPQPP